MEATEYLAHPVRGERLREIREDLFLLDNDNPYQVMGWIDGIKLCSYMTLFAENAGYDSVFGKVLDKFLIVRKMKAPFDYYKQNKACLIYMS